MQSAPEPTGVPLKIVRQGVGARPRGLWRPEDPVGASGVVVVRALEPVRVLAARSAQPLYEVGLGRTAASPGGGGRAPRLASAPDQECRVVAELRASCTLLPRSPAVATLAGSAWSPCPSSPKRSSSQESPYWAASASAKLSRIDECPIERLGEGDRVGEGGLLGEREAALRGAVPPGASGECCSSPRR